MEWIVPVLFVLATAAQWWLKRQHGSEDAPPTLPRKKGVESPTPQEGDPFEDFGDLLEALGRRRHESPPPVVSTPQPALPSPALPSATPPRWEIPSLVLPPALPVVIPPAPAPSKALTETPKSRRRHTTLEGHTPFRSRLRDAVVLSEILAPPLALR